jgi:hypothetical protein
MFPQCDAEWVCSVLAHHGGDVHSTTEFLLASLPQLAPEPPAPPQPCHLFRAPMDAWSMIAEHLSLVDLWHVGQTCHAGQHVLLAASERIKSLNLASCR